MIRSRGCRLDIWCGMSRIPLEERQSVPNASELRRSLLHLDKERGTGIEHEKDAIDAHFSFKMVT